MEANGTPQPNTPRKLIYAMTERRVREHSRQVNDITLEVAKDTGLCVCNITIAGVAPASAVEPNKPVLTSAVLVITGPMTTADMKRINDWFQGTAQDLAQGHKLTKQVNRSILEEGKPNE